MGMSISACLIVGLPYEDLYNSCAMHGGDELQEALDEMIDYGEIDTASPYYDSPRDVWIVGYAMSSVYETVGDEFVDEFKKKQVKFLELFGSRPRLYAAEDVT